MRVVLAKPNEEAEVIEVGSIQEINVLVHNVDKDGKGYRHVGSDIRMSIGKGVDLYCKEDAINNFDLDKNMWAPGDGAMYFGNILFAGYDNSKNADFGACSLTDEQIEYVMQFISKQRD